MYILKMASIIGHSLLTSHTQYSSIRTLGMMVGEVSSMRQRILIISVYYYIVIIVLVFFIFIN